MKKSIKLSTVLILSCFIATCVPPAVAVKQTVYTPKFTYSPSSSGEKIDVTIGLVSPQFTRPFEMNDVMRNYVSGIKSGFDELLSAKGFNITGPFDSVDIMTYPEKKGADLILYPEVDAYMSKKVERTGSRDDGNPWSGSRIVMLCDITLSVTGNISFIVKEPLSGEKMWIKRLEVTEPSQTFHLEGESCEGDSSVELKNAMAKMTESTFTAVMQALDKYVNGEEFVMLKKQAAELREKKAY